jgi:hypothetical protein
MCHGDADVPEPGAWGPRPVGAATPALAASGEGGGRAASSLARFAVRVDPDGCGDAEGGRRGPPSVGTASVTRHSAGGSADPYFRGFRMEEASDGGVVVNGILIPERRGCGDDGQGPVDPWRQACGADLLAARGQEADLAAVTDDGEAVLVNELVMN